MGLLRGLNEIINSKDCSMLKEEVIVTILKHPPVTLFSPKTSYVPDIVNNVVYSVTNILK